MTDHQREIPGVRLFAYRCYRGAVSAGAKLHLGRRVPALRKVYWWSQAKVRPHQLPVDGHWLEVHPADVAITHELALSGTYEPVITQVLTSVLDGSEFLVDIGANIGYYTAMVGRRLGSEGLVLAVEPDELNFEILRRNIARDPAVNSSTTALNIALNDHPGLISIFKSSNNMGDHRTYYVPGREHYLVPALTLDQLISDLGRQPDIIKIDVQGSELNVFSGARRTLENADSLLLITEFWTEGLTRAGASPQEYADLLKDSGFTVFQVTPSGLRELSGAELDVLAKSTDTDTDLVCAKGVWLGRIRSDA